MKRKSGDVKLSNNPQKYQKNRTSNRPIFYILYHLLRFSCQLSTINNQQFFVYPCNTLTEGLHYLSSFSESVVF